MPRCSKGVWKNNANAPLEAFADGALWLMGVYGVCRNAKLLNITRYLAALIQLICYNLAKIMAIYSLNNKHPQIGKNCYIAENATVIGDVIIGNNSTIWFNAVIRGDLDSIIIGDDTNIQDGCVLHIDYNYKLIIGSRVTVGHKAMLHGCTINDECLIGINSVMLDGVTIGKHCIIGANTLITKNTKIPDNSLVIGSPGKIVRQTTPEEVEYIKWAAQHYVENITAYQTDFNKKL